MKAPRAKHARRSQVCSVACIEWYDFFPYGIRRCAVFNSLFPDLRSAGGERDRRLRTKRVPFRPAARASFLAISAPDSLMVDAMTTWYRRSATQFDRSAVHAAFNNSGLVLLRSAPVLWGDAAGGEWAGYGSPGEYAESHGGFTARSCIVRARVRSARSAYALARQTASPLAWGWRICHVGRQFLPPPAIPAPDRRETSRVPGMV